MHRYFAGGRWERDGQVYRSLGVRAITPFVAGGSFWKRLGYRPRRNWTVATASAYVKASIALEVAHTASFLVLLLVMIYALTIGDRVAAAVILTFNVLLNLCPVMVCRYRRLSLTAAFRKRDRRVRQSG